MERLAAFLRFLAVFVVRVRKPYIIGITGSVGKTTTTEMISFVLKKSEGKCLVGPVSCTENNMNDDLGLPATLLLFGNLKEEYVPSRFITACLAPFRALQIIVGIRPYPKIFVLEYGTSRLGHIARLAALARPDIAIVTTIGAAHLERLKSLEGVAREKMALVQAVPPTGLTILGTEHDFVPLLKQASQSPVILVEGKGTEFAAKAAREICRHLSIPDVVIDDGLKAFKTPKGRMNIQEFRDMTVIDDSYNANPTSMKYGLDMLAGTAKPGERRVAVLGFMAELGEQGPQYHKEIGTYARSRADLLIGFGELARLYNADHWFENSESCAAQISSLVRPYDRIFIKGSGSARGRKIVESVLEIAKPLRDDSANETSR